MNRRSFLTTSVAASTAASLVALPTADAAESATGREFYEWRTIRLKDTAKQKAFEDYMGEASIPALGRLGIGPVGVFKPESGEPLLHTLTPYKSLEQYIGTADALRRDAAYVKAAEAHANAPATDPAYDRIESSLLLAFAGMPKLQAPGNGSRLFEFRIYESHSRKANKKKIEMFNVGEIEIFKRTGLTPVFFGESIIGARLPNLSYMLVFKDRAERDKNWGVFVKDPAWDKLKSTPGYADKEIVSKITNVFLVPAACSQI